MTISMIGIDHDRAPVDVRALFAFTKKNAGEAMEQLKERAGIHGCIILSTCNRLEIWASHEDDQEFSLYRCLCELKNIQDPSYEEYFISRQDKEAVEHLFYLAGGLSLRFLAKIRSLRRSRMPIQPGERALYDRRRFGSSFPYGSNSREEDQDRGTDGTWKSICDSSGGQYLKRTGI